VMASAFDRVPDPTKLTLIPRAFTLENIRVAADRGIFRYLGNSFFVVGIGLLLQMLVSVFAAYALARKKFRFMTVVLLVVLATMMLPEEILAIPLSIVLSDVPVVHVDLLGSLWGMILPVTAWGFSILVMTEFMKEVPVELEEAARIDGAGPLGIALSLKLPLMRKWIAYMAILSFATGTQLFVEPQLVNQASLGLVPDTWSSNQLAYQTAFRYADFNGAAAIAVDLLAIGLLAAVVIVTRTGLFRRED
jgi:multiple sugar transport system permease protein